jgi:hypothetical protein
MSRKKGDGQRIRDKVKTESRQEKDEQDDKSEERENKNRLVGLIHYAGRSFRLRERSVHMSA